MRKLHWTEAWHLLTHWWRSEEKKVAWLGLTALIIASLLVVYSSVLLNNWSREFFTSLEQKDLKKFTHLIIQFSIIIAFMIFTFCTKNYLNLWYSFRWRNWLTKYLEKKWLLSRSYYITPLQDDDLDNPDQRLTEDIKRFSYSGVNLFITFFGEGVNVITFSIMLWGLSHNISFPIFDQIIKIPGLLIWVAFFYSAIGIVTTFLVGKKLINLQAQQDQREGDFRFRLMKIREWREEIAQLRGEPFELQMLDNSFLALTKNYYNILRKTIYVNALQNFYMNGNTIIPLIIIAPLYFAGTLTLGVMMQIRGIFTYISHSLLSISFSFIEITGWLAALKRLQIFEKRNNEARNLTPSIPVSDHIDIKNIKIFSNHGSLIANFSRFEIKPGQKAVIIGRSGLGKSSLLRVLSGIYPYYEGQVSRPEQGFMIIPQRSYLPLGTLKEALTYPSLIGDDSLIQKYLFKTKLEHLIPFLSVPNEYQKSLSAGEQQRIHFIRAILHKPKILVMDEPISHLDQALAQEILFYVVEELPNTTIVLISHQPIEGFDIINLE